MSKIDNGGPAFPIDVPGHRIEMGISKRDYFAEKAMQGMLADSAFDGEPDEIALASFRMADAMLRAREAS